jgi:transcription-repair coupling factor (superfamily II helicase)
LRLAYYRALTQISSETDIDGLESELRDQFGKPPTEVVNLFGIMLIRKACIDLGVRDISSGKDAIILTFTDNTPITPQQIIQLTNMNNKKYSLSPDNRLKIRLSDHAWPKVYDEVTQLLRL